MRKYTAIARIMFKTQLVYRFDACMTALNVTAQIVFAWLLWGAIFESRSTVAGFTFSQMSAYYVIHCFLTQCSRSDSISSEISDKVKNGTFSRYLVIPVHVNGYFTAQTLGTMMYYLSFVLAASGIWFVLLGSGSALTTDLFCLCTAICMAMIGLFFMMQLNLFLGLLAFRFLDIGSFLMIKDNLILFLAGGLMPLALLPAGILAAMKLLPFYYLTYLPSMLFLGKCREEAISGLVILSFWLIAFLILNHCYYRHIRTIYDGAGC